MNMRHVFSTLKTVLFLSSILFLAWQADAKESPLFSQEEVGRYGLTRTWFNQVEIDSSRSKVLHVLLEGDTLFVVTDDAKLHAIHAESGKSLWLRSLGRRDLMFQEPAANSRMVAVLNGLELFVFNRRNGKLLMQASLPGAASTACEISENYVYVPMMGGRLIAYPLEDNMTKMEDAEGIPASAPQAVVQEDADQEPDAPATNKEDDPVLANIVKQFDAAKQSVMAEPKIQPKEPEIVLRPPVGIPMVCQSFGNLMVKPKLSSQIIIYTPRNQVRMHRETLVWVTDRGFLFGAGVNSLSKEVFELQYMVDSSSQTYYLASDGIAKREWTQDKEIVVRPTANQCVPFLYTDNKPQASQIPSMVVSGSKGSYVFAVKDRTGEVQWQFAASGPILEQIGVIGTDVYCPSSGDAGGLHALDIMTGDQKWFAPDIRRFIAASKNRLYTIDRRARFVVLDRRTGNPLASFDARKYDRFQFNVETDRIYVISDTGLIQCLVERQPQAKGDIAENKAIPVIRHRLNCRQYAETLRGKKLPALYWMPKQEGEAAESAETDQADATDDDPFGSVRTKKKSGDDASMDGEGTDDKPKPKRDDAKPKQNDAEADPFG